MACSKVKFRNYEISLNHTLAKREDKCTQLFTKCLRFKFSTKTTEPNVLLRDKVHVSPFHIDTWVLFRKCRPLAFVCSPRLRFIPHADMLCLLHGRRSYCLSSTNKWALQISDTRYSFILSLLHLLIILLTLDQGTHLLFSSSSCYLATFFLSILLNISTHHVTFIFFLKDWASLMLSVFLPLSLSNVHFRFSFITKRPWIH